MCKVDNAIGEALHATSVPRHQIFITTKFWPNFARDPGLCLDLQLEKFRIPYVDLLLMHWPIAIFPNDSLRTAVSHSDNPEDLGMEFVDIESRIPAIDLEFANNLSLQWKLMEDVCRAGKTKALGVSNFSISQLEKLLPVVSPDTPLCVNQIEAHPLLPNTELINYCHSKGIVVQTYCPFGGSSSSKHRRPVDDPAVLKIASARGWTTGQLLQSWAVQRGTVPLGRSENIDRLKSNRRIGRLTDAEMETLNNLKLEGDEGRIVKGGPNWDWEFFK